MLVASLSTHTSSSFLLSQLVLAAAAAALAAAAAEEVVRDLSLSPGMGLGMDDLRRTDDMSVDV